MAMRRVQPGDLITADDWNLMASAMDDLELRLSLLEQGGTGLAPVITQVLPTGTVTAGDRLEIFGRNFDFLRGGHSVLFNSSRVATYLGGSSDTKLILLIPDEVEGATEAGAPVTMTVANLTSYTSRSITVRAKPVVATGSIDLTFDRSEPATPRLGEQITFSFTLRSNTNNATTVTITPFTLRTGGGPIVPDASLVVLHDGEVRADRTIPLPEGAAVTVGVRIPAIPDTLPSTTTFTLQVSASAPGLPTDVEVVPNLAIDVPVETPDPTIESLSFSRIVEGLGTFTPATGGGVAGRLRMEANTITIALDTGFANIPAGSRFTYDLSAAVEPPTSGWGAQVNALSTPTSYEIASPGGQRFPFFDITAPQGGGTVRVRFTITRRGPATGNRRALTIEVQR